MATISNLVAGKFTTLKADLPYFTPTKLGVLTNDRCLTQRCRPTRNVED